MSGDRLSDFPPPWSEDAEQAVLSAMLMDQDAVVRAAEVVDDTMFYGDRHRRIFRAMIALAERGSVVDVLLLAAELERRGELEAAGGKDYLGYLIDAVPTAANVAYHAELVREKAVVRALIAAATRIVHDARTGSVDAGQLLDSAEAEVLAVARQGKQSGLVRVKERLWATMEHIEAIQRHGETVTGVASGFADLDDITSGFQPADLIIVAARPSMGKTAFCLNIAQHAAIETNVGVAIFSLEMSMHSLTQRLLTSEARVDSQKMRRGMLRDDDFPKLSRAAGILSAAPIWIDDTANATTLDIRSRARRLKSEHDGFGLVIVDYLQLMQGHARAENRNQEVSQISRGLKALAKELNVPVVALSQLSRAPDQRGGDHKPQLSDLRESGAIEQDADLIMFIWRPEVYLGPVDSQGNSTEGKAELIVAKQRNGPIGTVNLHFQKQFTRFASWSPRLVAQ